VLLLVLACGGKHIPGKYPTTFRVWSAPLWDSTENKNEVCPIVIFARVTEHEPMQISFGNSKNILGVAGTYNTAIKGGTVLRMSVSFSQPDYPWTTEHRSVVSIRCYQRIGKDRMPAADLSEWEEE
jgi:hypothetical protein